MSVQVLGEDVLGDQGVFDDLEIEHSDAGEVGPIFESILEAVPRMNGAGPGVPS